uniref:Uncharacterized protein n=1 Tax=Arundo donax TaxID=35708 RepID=A0A0A9CCU6_ARUDO
MTPQPCGRPGMAFTRFWIAPKRGGNTTIQPAVVENRIKIHQR